MRELLAALREPRTAAPPALVPVGCRRVKFRGERGGDGPLTTGQRNTLRWVSDAAAYTRMVEWPLDMPEGTTLDDVEAALCVLMGRYESLRTSYPPAQVPIQRAAESGELVITLYQASNGHNDKTALTAALAAELRSGEFDVTRGLPLRVGVVLSEGLPATAVAVFSHMAVDLGAMAVIGQQFTRLAGDPGSRQLGQPCRQPLDQAAAERSPRGRRTARAALRAWETQLRRMPQCLYSAPSRGPAGEREPLVGWLWSQAAAQALPHICERTQASAQQVVLAAVCAVLSVRTGEALCSFTTLMHNRYDRALRDYVGTISCDTIICVDTRVPGFDELVRRAGVATLKAAIGGFVDGTELAALVGRVEHERGTCYFRDCVYNDFSYAEASVSAGPGPAPAGPADAAAALERTELRWEQPAQTTQMLSIFLVQVHQEVILGAATAAPSRVPRADLESILRGVELLLVAAASGDVSMDDAGQITGLAPIQRGPGWVRADSCWAELAEVQRLLDDALEVPAARVFCDGGPGAGTLVAYVTAGQEIRTPEQAHAACMAVLRQGKGDERRYTAIAPASYVICAEPPSDPADLPSWQRQPVLASGSGRVTQAAA